jgi:propionyl-CoA carboxylase alpha chain
MDARDFAIQFEDMTEGYCLHNRGCTMAAIVCSPSAALIHQKLPEKEKPDTSKLVSSPMPGSIVRVDVSAGQKVRLGEALLVVEAMKMENVIRAEQDGIVAEVLVAAGETVNADQLMVKLQ